MMRLPRSLLVRIILLHAAAVITTAICLSLLVGYAANRTATDLQRRSLQEHAVSISHYLKIQPDGKIQADLPQELRALYSAHYGRFAVSVYDESGRELLTVGRETGISPDATTPVDEASFSGNMNHEHSTYSGLFPARVGNRTVQIRLSENLGHGDALLDDMARAVAWPIIATMGLLLTTLVLANIAIVRWATAPLESAADEARAIGPENLSLRLSTERTPQEVQPLVAAFNVALERLEAGFRLQKEFTADAAHELRTPLAVLRARIETMPPTANTSELIADVEAMTRTLNQLLMAAQLEEPDNEGAGACNISDVATQEVASLAPLAIADRKTIELIVPDSEVIVRGNALSYSWAIRNLLENALRHSPPSGSIEVVISADGTVTVSDSGPGVSAADRAKIFQRFWRGDRGSSQHAGLGLSIVYRAVTANGGTVSVDDRVGGGAVFRMSLARPQETSAAHT